MGRTFLCLLADHSLCQKVGKRLSDLYITKVIHHPCVESCVEQMKDCMLYPSDILVNRHPVIHPLFIKRPSVIIRTGISKKVPG